MDLDFSVLGLGLKCLRILGLRFGVQGLSALALVYYLRLGFWIRGLRVSISLHDGKLIETRHWQKPCQAYPFASKAHLLRWCNMEVL